MLQRPVSGLAIARGGGLSGVDPSLGGGLPGCVWRVQGGDTCDSIHFNVHNTQTAVKVRVNIRVPVPALARQQEEKIRIAVCQIYYSARQPFYLALPHFVL